MRAHVSPCSTYRPAHLRSIVQRAELLSMVDIKSMGGEAEQLPMMGAS